MIKFRPADCIHYILHLLAHGLPSTVGLKGVLDGLDIAITQVCETNRVGTHWNRVTLV